jgi:hypothetical protein
LCTGDGTSSAKQYSFHKSRCRSERLGQKPTKGCSAEEEEEEEEEE